jgi:hypothetical protein
MNVAVLVVAAALCACTPAKKDESTREVAWETYKPTGSHIRERADGRRSPKNSSSAPVRDVQDVPAVTIIPNQAPK